MKNVLHSLSEGAKVAVVRLRSLGDCVLTTPALAILKASRPDLNVGVVVEERFAAVFDNSPNVQTILSPSVYRLRQWQPELCLNLHGGTRSMVLTASSGARTRAGFAHHRGASVYSISIPRAQEILGIERKVHTAEHLASAIFHLGAEQRTIPRAGLFPKPAKRTRPYAILHAVASTPEKTWKAEGFIAAAEHLRRNDIEPVFVGGPRDDLQPFSKYEMAKGTLADNIQLISGASLFIGNDSGPAHIAAAFGISVVVLFGPSDPVVWAPWQTPSEVLQSSNIAEIKIDRVIEAIEALKVTQ